MGDSIFINTTYSFNSAVKSTEKYAHELILKDGGKINDKKIMVKTQIPVATCLKYLFPMWYLIKQFRFLMNTGWSLKETGNLLN